MRAVVLRAALWLVALLAARPAPPPAAPLAAALTRLWATVRLLGEDLDMRHLTLFLVASSAAAWLPRLLQVRVERPPPAQLVDVDQVLVDLYTVELAAARLEGEARTDAQGAHQRLEACLAHLVRSWTAAPAGEARAA